VELAAHSIKGSSANLGATRLAELTGHLEALGRAGALGGAGALVDDVAAELERVRAALAKVVAVR
jgi:HPt (histidine-containing phosphotransfer) domain-containing protein